MDEAVREVELLIGRCRVDDVPQQAQFITGNGEIKKAVLRILDDYGLSGEEQWGNPGVIVVTLL